MKNRRIFHGRPIVAYSIEAARACGLFERIVVSTEDRGVAIVANQCKAEVLARPVELAEIGAPDCGTQEVTRHALETLGITDGYACCIYPCAPMMTAQDLRFGFECLKDDRLRYAFVPGWYYFGLAKHFLERRNFDESLPVWVHPDRHVDINVEEDWLHVERLYAERHGIAA